MEHDRTALDDIAAERRRQREAEGWTPEHDDAHATGAMAAAAAVYALHSTREGHPMPASVIDAAVRQFWPWEWSWWKPKDRRRDLVRAAALLVAEIERLDREAARAR